MPHGLSIANSGDERRCTVTSTHHNVASSRPSPALLEQARELRIRLTRYTETAVDPPENRIGVEFHVEGEFDLLPGKPAELGELRNILEDFFCAEGRAEA
jgi:hypothetical protein